MIVYFLHACLHTIHLYVRMPKNVRNAWRGTFVIPYRGILLFLVPQLAVYNVDQHAKILTPHGLLPTLPTSTYH